MREAAFHHNLSSRLRQLAQMYGRVPKVVDAAAAAEEERAKNGAYQVKDA